MDFLTSESGAPIIEQNLIKRYFKPALKKAGLSDIRFHDLRHTYASLLIEQGENIKYIQNQLGHSSPTVTLNVYSHLMKSENQEAVCRLENTIFEETGHNLVTEKFAVNFEIVKREKNMQKEPQQGILIRTCFLWKAV